MCVVHVHVHSHFLTLLNKFPHLNHSFTCNTHYFVGIQNFEVTFMIMMMRVRVCFFCVLIVTYCNVCQSTFSTSDTVNGMDSNGAHDSRLNTKVSFEEYFDHNGKICVL